MTTVYVCLQGSVYNHAITGVYTTPERAIEGARLAIEAEDDHYHTITVYEVPLDQLTEFDDGRARSWDQIGDMEWVRDEPAPMFPYAPDEGERRRLSDVYISWKRSGRAVWRARS